MEFDARVWGTVGEWIAGLATFAAVLVSLWLVRRNEREQLDMVPTLIVDGPNRALTVEIENVCARPVRVVSVAIVARIKGQTPGRIAYPYVGIPARLQPWEHVITSWPSGQIGEGFAAIRKTMSGVEKAQLSIEARTARGNTFRVACPEIRGMPVSVYDPLTDRFHELP